MATIDDIIKWSGGLPAWQADAIRRHLLVGEDDLSQQDFEQIVTLARAHLKLTPPPSFAAEVPALGMFSGTSSAKHLVSLEAVNDVRHVNLIEPGKSLTFAESGICIVYGGNGSGKSGYARVLKMACNARDKNDRILPNVFLPGPHPEPSALFKIRLNTVSTDVPWKMGQTANPLLSEVTVFDARCARILTDEQNAVT